MRSPKMASCNLLFASVLISLLLGSIASPIIGDEQSWTTLGEPEFLAYDTPDAANLPNPPSSPDTGADWTSLTALLNNAQLGNTATEVFVPQQQENIPYLISDGMVEGTASFPQARGPPEPLRPDLEEWDFRKYPGYPSEDSPALYDPKTGMYWAQKRLACSGGKKLFCCRPNDIKCSTCECRIIFFFLLLFLLFFGRKTASDKEGHRLSALLHKPGKRIAFASEPKVYFFFFIFLFCSCHLLIFGLLIYSLHGIIVMSKWPQCIPKQQRCCNKIDNVSECYILYVHTRTYKFYKPRSHGSPLDKNIMSDENGFR